MVSLRLSSISFLAFLGGFIPLTAQAQVVDDYATTADQHTVARTFDSKAAAAAPGSSLDQDNTRILSGTSAQINQSAQSMLPTTAYTMTGAASTLASREDANISSRLRSLRNRDMLTPSRMVSSSARERTITPLQKTNEAFHDLRANPKSPVMTGGHNVVNSYPSSSPAMYRDNRGAAQTTSPTKTEVEKTYDESIRLATIGAGVPNATKRGTNAPRVRNVPNMADRTTSEALQYAGDLGGQGQINATAKNGLPRHTMTTSMDKKREPSSIYRGQPLGTLSVAPLSSPAPMPLTPARSVGSNPYNVAPPVIYGPNDPLPPDMMPGAAPTAMTASLAPTPAAAPSIPVQESFTYRKIDQSSSLTTPMIGSPSRASVRIPQQNTFALLASSPGINVEGYTGPRKTTDAGTLLWAEENNVTSGQTQALPSQPASLESLMGNEQPMLATSPSYGTKAVPLSGISSDRRWGFFITGDGGFGSNKLQNDSEKTETVTGGFTVGADYKLQDKSYVGLALTYAHANFSTGNYGDVSADSMSVSLYGTTEYANNAYFDGYISVGYHTLDSERTVYSGAGTTRTANASPDGFQFSGKAETGYDVKNDNVSYGPFAAFRLSYADFGGFTESGAGNFNLKIDGQDNLSAIASLGVNAAGRYDLADGTTLLPGLRMGYNHEFGDTTNSIKAEFANMSGSAFTTKSAKKSRDWLNLTPSLTVSFANDWSLLAQYEHDFFRDDVNENIFSLTAQRKW